MESLLMIALHGAVLGIPFRVLSHGDSLWVRATKLVPGLPSRSRTYIIDDAPLCVIQRILFCRKVAVSNDEFSPMPSIQFPANWAATPSFEVLVEKRNVIT